jgi:hypothetical protein
MRLQREKEQNDISRVTINVTMDGRVTVNCRDHPHLAFCMESGDEQTDGAPELNVREVLLLPVQQYFLAFFAPERRKNEHRDKLSSRHQIADCWFFETGVKGSTASFDSPEIASVALEYELVFFPSRWFSLGPHGRLSSCRRERSWIGLHVHGR